MAFLRGEVEAAPAAFSLPDLLERAVDLHGGLEEPDASEIRVDGAAGSPAVLVNEGRCLRLFLLFFEVAIRFGHRGSATLDVTADGDGVEVSFPVHEGDPVSALKPLDRVAGLDGGSVRFAEGRGRLRLLSLSAARALGR